MQLSVEAIQAGVFGAVPDPAFKILSYFYALRDPHGNVLPVYSQSCSTHDGPINQALGMAHGTVSKWVNWLERHGIIEQVRVGIANEFYGRPETGKRPRIWHLSGTISQCEKENCDCHSMSVDKSKLWTFADGISLNFGLLQGKSLNFGLNDSQGDLGSDTREIKDSADSKVVKSIKSLTTITTEADASSVVDAAEKAVLKAEKLRAVVEWFTERDLSVDYAVVNKCLKNYLGNVSFQALRNLAPALWNITGYNLVCDYGIMIPFCQALASLHSLNATAAKLQAWHQARLIEGWTPAMFTLKSVPKNYASQPAQEVLFVGKSTSEVHDADKLARMKAAAAERKANLASINNRRGQSL